MCSCYVSFCEFRAKDQCIHEIVESRAYLVPYRLFLELVHAESVVMVMYNNSDRNTQGLRLIISRFDTKLKHSVHPI